MLHRTTTAILPSGTRLLVWLLSKTSDLAMRLMGADARKHREDITPAEIRDMVVAHRGFTPEQRMIIAGAVEITERVLREVLVPRRAVFTIDADTPVDVARSQLAQSGHSRGPVVRRGNLDETIGVVLLRDLVAGDVISVTDAARPAYLLPDSLRVADALRGSKLIGNSLALVVDEHGFVDGIVTLEDLVGELVGEIYDETDRDVAQAMRATRCTDHRSISQASVPMAAWSSEHGHLGGDAGSAGPADQPHRGAASVSWRGGTQRIRRAGGARLAACRRWSHR